MTRLRISAGFMFLGTILLVIIGSVLIAYYDTSFPFTDYAKYGFFLLWLCGFAICIQISRILEFPRLGATSQWFAQFFIATALSLFLVMISFVVTENLGRSI